MAGRPPDGALRARTLLELLLWREDATYEEVVNRFERVAAQCGERATLTSRHLRRLASGGRAGTTPVTRRVLQVMFGQPIDVLLSAPDSETLPGDVAPTERVLATTDKEMLTMAAQRARKFALSSSTGALPGETLDQLYDDVAQLSVTYQQRPVAEFLGDLVQTQDDLFTLLEGRQPPRQTRQLLLLAGVTSGLLAKVSHDFADPHAALTQSRTAFLCADNADHNGLRAWIRGLQSLISYWAGRYHEAVRYAREGASHSSANTTSVWLPVSEARAWSALGNAHEARAAIQRSLDARDRVQPDELDELGGLCTFSYARQLYYTADAYAWLPSEARVAERHALDAVAAYSNPSAHDWAFGDASGSACDLAISRIALGEVHGAAEALDPVLELPPDRRINGVVLSVNQVYAALRRLESGTSGTEVRELQERCELFTATPAAALRP